MIYVNRSPPPSPATLVEFCSDSFQLPDYYVTHLGPFSLFLPLHLLSQLFVASHEKFHAEAAGNYWKSIGELIPNEVPTIEKKKGKKDDEKKPSIVVINGPKPGKATDLSRMRQILLKLKHNTPPHLKPSPPAGPSTKADSASAPVATAVASSSEPVAVA